MRPWTIIALLTVFVAFSACQAPKPVHDVTPSGFLGPDVVAKLTHGGPEGPAWIYNNPDAKWASYDKMLLDPVTFWMAPGSKDQGISQAERQKLVDYFYRVIYNTMSKHVTMVSAPGSGVMRVRVALTKAEPSVVALDVISTVVPQAAVLSSLKDAITGKPAFVGEAQVAVKVTDSVSGELLAAWVASRVGGKRLDAAQLSSWGDVEQAMRFWADSAAYRLCKVQKRQGCQPPKH
ncbi:MAG: DUF3313 domain-containing protein [Deltaproteobacteria bacterium]|jgi:hypothetical protein